MKRRPHFIFLHGVDANRSQLAGLARRWAHRFPDARMTVPDAPFIFDGAKDETRRQWYSLQNITEDELPDRVAATRHAFDRVLENVVSKGDNDSLALVGFSQGGTMALDAVMAGRWTIPILITFGARNALRHGEPPARQGRALLLHGETDPVVPPDNSIRACSVLRAAGLDATCTILPDEGHAISRRAIRLAESFLSTICRDRFPALHGTS